MTKAQMELQIERLWTRLNYFQRIQKHMRSHIDLLEENLDELKLYLDTLSPLPEKHFDLLQKVETIEDIVDEHTKTLANKKGAQ